MFEKSTMGRRYSSLIPHGTRVVVGEQNDLNNFISILDKRTTPIEKIYITDQTDKQTVENILFKLRNYSINNITPIEIYISRNLLEQPLLYSSIESSIVELCKYAEKLRTTVWIFFKTLYKCPLCIRDCSYYFISVGNNRCLFAEQVPLNQKIKDDNYINSLSVYELTD